MLKRITASILLGFIAVCFMATYSSAQTASTVGDELLRLHVIANSDSTIDQELKLKVRDELLSEAKSIYENTDNKEQVIRISNENLTNFELIANKVISANGFNYEAKAYVTKCYFPTKTYNNGFRLPAGYYDALRVELGEAKGKNWWCILYPPLCLVGSSKGNDKVMNDILKANQIEFVKAGTDKAEIEVKFKLAEVWGKITEFFS